MSLADHIAPTLAARARRAAALRAEREREDAVLLVAFATLLSRFDELLALALGQHAAVSLTRAPLTLPAVGRSFTTLPGSRWAARATFNGPAQTVGFTPALDFSGPGQFGRITADADFSFIPTARRGDRLVQLLLQRGVRMQGLASPRLLLPWPQGAQELAVSDLETAFTAWWLR